MTVYAAPLAEMQFALDTAAGLGEIATLPGMEAAAPDLVQSVLDAAASFAGEVLAPLNPIGDRNPTRLENGVVLTPPGFKEAYRDFVAGGWGGLSLPAEAGGMGLPQAIGTAVWEMWTSANLAFSLCPVLTLSAAELLIAHGSDTQRRLYLAKIASGQWAGTMNLTEPQAGSDVGAVRCRAVKDGDHYRITGQKIFITYGDHDLTENIVHMVLARTPGAPPGTKGISLFVVPKFLVNDDGSLGAANDVRCVKLEEKLGIHASPTAVLSYGEDGGAIGTLVGEEQRGIEYMFLMMNGARLNVGLQGVSIAERAYQQAREFARSRVQGKPVGAAGPGELPILHHPDVRRMLLSMRAKTEAARALLYYTSGMIDRARAHPDGAARARSQARVDLLIPVAKAWSTDAGFDVASTNIQVHGGMGYIEETGAAQHLRDARIALIYEGTNGIQANDLVSRKLVRDGGAAMRDFVAEMRGTESELFAAADEALSAIAPHLHAGLDALESASDALVATYRASAAEALGSAVPYLRLFGLVVGGWLMARQALEALRRTKSGEGDAAFLRAKLMTARFHGEHELAAAPALLPAIRGGATVMGFDLDQL